MMHLSFCFHWTRCAHIRIFNCINIIDYIVIRLTQTIVLGYVSVSVCFRAGQEFRFRMSPGKCPTHRIRPATSKRPATSAQLMRPHWFRQWYERLVWYRMVNHPVWSFRHRTPLLRAFWPNVLHSLCHVLMAKRNTNECDVGIGSAQQREITITWPIMMPYEKWEDSSNLSKYCWIDESDIMERMTFWFFARIIQMELKEDRGFTKNFVYTISR